MKPKGFTLIEIMVSVAIFAVVMTIALGSLLAMAESSRKAQTLKSVINNLNFSLDSISRLTRTGETYHCDVTQSPVTSPRDCVSGSSSFAVLAASGQTVQYKLETTDTSICGQPTGSVGCIVRSVGGGAYAALTSPEVYVTTLTFYVSGSAFSSTLQPKVTILMSGTVAVKAGQNSVFNLQTSVTQRLYDN